MKLFFTITVLLLAPYGRAFGNPASDERELTQLVKELNAALVKADIAFLRESCTKTIPISARTASSRMRAQYLKNRKRRVLNSSP